MDIEYNDICKKMEAKGYEYIQQYCVKLIFNRL